MRMLFAVVAFAAGVGGLAAQEPKTQELKTYESKEGKFSAKFPIPPAPPLAKSAGGLVLNIFNADVDKGKGGYLVTYSDLPADVLKAPTPAKVLESSEKVFAESFKAKVLKSSATEFGPKKYPARDLTAERGDWNMHTILVLVGTRMYQVSVYGTKDFVASKEADAFLASFAITQ
jgi:hypothetical protein